MPRTPNKAPATGGRFFWDLLTFERMMTSQVVHLVYWAGLSLIAVGAFGVLGASVGVAIREGTFLGSLLALAMLGTGSLGAIVAALLWRSFCEFYVTICKIGEDLNALRRDAEAERVRQNGPTPN